jgi:glycosyltransferase involved in cell wall biosynthesis
VNTSTTTTKKLSVIIPVTERFDPISELFHEYKRGVETTGLDYEFIYVVDGEQPDALSKLIQLQETEKLTVITLAKKFGESTALSAAFSKISGNIILTLPAYQQIEIDDIAKLVASIDDYDMVLARRWPRKDSLLNRLQNNLFNSILRLSTDLDIHDAGCSARVFSKEVIDEIQLYGDLHRFFPVMAHRQGFRVIEIDVTQAKKDTSPRIYSPGIYVRRLLDLLTIFFLVKFTKKPLRFFGLVGTTLFSLGVISSLYLIGEKLFFDVGLADRPALFLSSLLIVLGVQIIAIGLIGEIIIFTHAKDLKEYKIDKIINNNSTTKD